MLAVTRAPRVQAPTELKVVLNESEQNICELLCKFTEHLKNEKNVTNTCRIAGGWVRDKLLGMQSNDIDIALSDCTGAPFATDLKEFASTLGIDTGKIAIIKKNPEQSKHLEAATFKIFGLELDFVNLRSEEYTTESRIPTIRHGTPLEDAQRRDMTINAMFYNIHTQEIEDLTNKGMSDLKDGVIRTPLPPHETFLDDPLRVLRCIRFSSRFGFTLTPEIEESVKKYEIQEALVLKVRKDRIGEELSKMMKGNDPFKSIQLIFDLGLYPTLFESFPPKISASISPPLKSNADSVKAATILHYLLHTESNPGPIPSLHQSILEGVKSDATAPSRLYLGAALAPFLGCSYVEKGKQIPVVAYVLRELLRLGSQNHFLDGVPALYSASRILTSSNLNNRSPSERVAIGTLLREKVVHNPSTGSHWTTSLLFSLVVELLPFYNLDTNTIDEKEATSIIQAYNTFVNRVHELNLTNVADLKPLFNGQEVSKLLARTPGPWMGALLQDIIIWQLDHPEGTKEDLSAYLLESDKVEEPVSKKPRIE